MCVCLCLLKNGYLGPNRNLFLRSNQVKTGIQTFLLVLIFTVRLLPSPVQLRPARSPVQSVVGAAKDFGQVGGQEERKVREEEMGRTRRRPGGIPPSQVAETFEGVRGEAEGPESRPSPGHQQVRTVCCQFLISLTWCSMD